MMKASESDLMKGIDDKFQKLLSQFEMNMNILELKSKRQQYLIEKSKEAVIDNVTLDEVDEPFQSKHPRNDPGNISEKKECDSGHDNEATIKAVKESSRPVEEVSPSQQQNSNNLVKAVSFELDESKEKNSNIAQPIKEVDTMGIVLKYISECAEMQNKKKKKSNNKNISFNPNDFNQAESSNNTKSMTPQNSHESKNKPNKKKSPYGSDNLSGTGSNKKSKSNPTLVKKRSMSVTNVSKKVKKRTLKNLSNNYRKDWISYNRINAGKNQKSTKQPRKTEQGIKRLPSEIPDDKSNLEPIKTQLLDQKSCGRVKRTVEHFETVENELLNDFFKNKLPEISNNQVINDIQTKTNKNTGREKISFRCAEPVKALHEEDTNVMNNKTNFNFEWNKKNIKYDKIKKTLARGNGIVSDAKRIVDESKKLVTKDSLNKAKPHSSEIKLGRKMDTRQSVTSNLETRVQKEKYHEQNEKVMELEDIRPNSAFKVSSRYMTDLTKNEEKMGDLESVKLGLDEFFGEIPFVVGRSISRTYNLGLSFQYAMSLLRRMHGKKEVKDVLNVKRQESLCGSELTHCQGMNYCEALNHPDWTKEDEKAWEENPWDPELNRKRPKCTCLPNNSTSLKNVLKQLAAKNPGFHPKLQQSVSTTTTDKNFEAALSLKPDLKRSQSQTRTELLRNIRTIQIQLTPSTEILK